MARTLPSTMIERRRRVRPPLRWGRMAAGLLAPIATLALVLLAWQAYVSLRDVPEYLVPGPGAVLDRFLDAPWYFYRNGLVTLAEAVLGLALGGALAFAVGVALAASRPLERAVLPWAIALKVTPIVAVAPLFTIWFGFGLLPKVLIAGLIAFFPILIGAIAGLRAANPASLELLRSLDASAWEVFWHLRLPSALPYLFAALKVGVTLALIGAVVAEWTGAGDGLGRVILLAHSNLDLPTLFAAVFTLASLGVALTGALSLIESRLLFWHDAHRDGAP